jgi:hypothetical protein
VALTKIDEYDPTLAVDLKQLPSSSSLATLLARLSQASGIPPNAIFPIKNFSAEYHPPGRQPSSGPPAVQPAAPRAAVCSDVSRGGVRAGREQ